MGLQFEREGICVGSSVQCPVDSETISLVLDGEADPQQRQTYQEHLEGCAGCRQQHEFYSRLRSTVRTACSGETCPELLKARLLQALSKEVAAPALPAAVAASPAMTGGSVRPRGMKGVAWLAAASAAAFSFYALRPATDKAPPLALSLSEDHSRCCDKPAGATPGNPAQLAQQTFGSTMPEMAQVNQLQPYDVRLCSVGHNEQVIHVLSRDGQNRVISMYTMPGHKFAGVKANEASPDIYETPHARVATWEHKGWVFSLVSRVPQEELASLAGQCSYGQPDQHVASPIGPDPMPRGLPVHAIPASHHP